jgi:hypothetical protein
MLFVNVTITFRLTKSNIYFVVIKIIVLKFRDKFLFPPE